MDRLDVFVSVVVPLHNDGSIVSRFAEELHPVLERTFADFEIVFIDDRSTDDTPAKVEELLRRHRYLRLIPLSRRMGVETALRAGLESAIGDFVVTMIPDTDPPQCLPEMVETARGGYDMVLGVVDKAARRGPFYRLLRRIFYGLCRSMVAVDLIPGATDYRVFSRQAVNALTRVRQRRPHFAVLISDIGYVSTTYRYEPISRSGTTKPPGTLASLRYGASLIVHNSTMPLRFVTILGLAGSLLSILYAGYVIAINLLLDTVAAGWTTLSFQVAGLFFLVFLILALVGEYLTRVIEETSHRPLYHSSDERISSIAPTDESRRNVVLKSGSDLRPQR